MTELQAAELLELTAELVELAGLLLGCFLFRMLVVGVGWFRR